MSDALFFCIGIAFLGVIAYRTDQVPSVPKIMEQCERQGEFTAKGKVFECRLQVEEQ